MTAIRIDTSTIASAVAKQGRVNRNPQHDFNLRTLPYQIKPFVIAPVLPGETLKNALLQVRAVSDPLRSPLIGWWSEWYVFYVKLRDLEIRDDLTEMLLTPGAATPVYDRGGNYGKYDTSTGLWVGGPAINYTRRCLDRVVEEYFRDEGDAPPLIGGSWDGDPGLPQATVQTREFWFDSAKLESAMPAGDDGTLPGEDDYADANIPPAWASHYDQYQRMRALKLTEVTFDDWLRQFGVKAPKEEREDLHRPELLRYVKDWTYPSNTVDPATGTPNTVCSWSIGERLDKARFFNEPGFIFGVNVTRPKIYVQQNAPAVEMLNSAFSWLPALMDGDPYTSLRRFDKSEGPLGDVLGAHQPNEAYWVDVRDLFLYGDQMSDNRRGASGEEQEQMRANGLNALPLPANDLSRRYTDTAGAKSFFKDAARTFIRADGVMQLTIAGHQTDHT